MNDRIMSSEEFKEDKDMSSVIKYVTLENLK